MTRDDIIRMAGEAAMAIAYNEREEDGWQELERFAALVAAAEREACVTICKKVEVKCGDHDKTGCFDCGWESAAIKCYSEISERADVPESRQPSASEEET